MKSKKPFYVLDMFPYPSGEGLHVGHVKVYSASDIYSRYKRMSGYDVLHPTGFDAFGLPAEQYALKNKVNPKISTQKNCGNFLRQMQDLNLAYDYDKVFSTTDPEFYKWTQWIFKQLYKRNLAFQSHEPINWCPSCMTGLANEDLENGKCERCGSVVEKKPLRQWVLRITDYADRLVDDLDTLPKWQPWIKDLQKNWIGRSEGSEIEFKVYIPSPTLPEREDLGGDELRLTVFTTRADTLFGCTYTVLAPEHELVKELIDKSLVTNRDEVLKYIDEVKQKTDIERSAEGREKTGVRLDGVMAINPAYTIGLKAGDTIPEAAYVPVYIADYVLASYGTGAIMAVPAHDERDFEFAKKFNIHIKDVVNADNKHSDGTLINSGEFDGMDSAEARVKITEAVGGRLVKKYKLRDWVFARQRYWGEPFPIVYEMIEDKDGKMIPNYDKPHLVADSELPVLLPDVESYEPTGTGESPLAIIPEFTNVYGYINDEGEFVSSDKDDVRAKLYYRETNTMPQWAGSSWYWLRFPDAHNNEKIFSEESQDRYPKVDIYVGGVEHATRHLIYGRFWHKFLYDLGYVKSIEPFERLETVGLVLGEGGVKMSKRLGNVVNPDDVIKEYGADVARMYVMFMGPFGQASAWDPKALMGIKRFLDRVKKIKEAIPSLGEGAQQGGRGELDTILNQTIKKVGDDIENFKFNTAISQMMICLNAIEDSIKNGNGVSKDEFDKYLAVLSPFAPELCGTFEEWPTYDETKLVDDTVTIAIQIGGKLRGTVDVTRDLQDDDVISKVKDTEAYKKYAVGANGAPTEPKKIIVVKNKIVNVVI